MSHFSLRAALVGAAGVVTGLVACSGGGAGTFFTDGGTTSDGGVDPTATETDASSSDASKAKRDGSSAADAKPAQTYPVTCAGFAAKAAAATSTCVEAKAASYCDSREASATANCATEWGTYIDCAVNGSVVVSCAFNGKPTIQRCDDEEAALATCLAKPPPQKVCPSSCTSNTQCQMQCPAPFGGHINCCDISTGVCYMSSSSTCL